MFNSSILLLCIGLSLAGCACKSLSPGPEGPNHPEVCAMMDASNAEFDSCSNEQLVEMLKTDVVDALGFMADHATWKRHTTNWMKLLEVRQTRAEDANDERLARKIAGMRVVVSRMMVESDIDNRADDLEVLKVRINTVFE